MHIEGASLYFFGDIIKDVVNMRLRLYRDKGAAQYLHSIDPA